MDTFARSPGLAFSPIIGLDKGILRKVGREVEEGVMDLDASIELLLSAGKFARRPGMSSPAAPGSDAKTPHRGQGASPMIPRFGLHSAKKTPNAGAAGRDGVRKNLAFSRLNEQLRQREAESLILGGSPMVGSKRISAAPTWWEEEDAQVHDSWYSDQGVMRGHGAEEEDDGEDAGALGLDLLLNAPDLGHHTTSGNGGSELGLSRRWSGGGSMASSTPMSSSMSSSGHHHHHHHHASSSSSSSSACLALPSCTSASSPTAMPSQGRSDAAIERIANAVGLARILARLDAQAMGETESMFQALIKYESQARQARGIIRCAVEQAPAASARWISTVGERLSSLLCAPDDAHAACLSDEGALEKRKGLSDALCVELRQALVDAETSVQAMKSDLRKTADENIELRESVAAARNALQRAISVSSEEAREAERRLAAAEAGAEELRLELSRTREGAEEREEAQRQALKRSEEASRDQWRRERDELEREVDLLKASMSVLHAEADEATREWERLKMRLAEGEAEMIAVQGEAEAREGEMAGLLSSFASSQVELETLRGRVASLESVLGASEEASKIRLEELEMEKLELGEALRAAEETHQCMMDRWRDAQEALAAKDREIASGEARIQGLETEVRVLRREMECEAAKLNKALAAKEAMLQEVLDGVCVMEDAVCAAEEIAGRCEAQLSKFGAEREEMRRGYASLRRELDELLILQRDREGQLRDAREEGARGHAEAIKREEGLREELECARQAISAARLSESQFKGKVEVIQGEQEDKTKMMENELREVKEALEASRETIGSMSRRMQEDDKVIEELRVSGMALKRERVCIMTALGAIRSEKEEMRGERDEIGGKLSSVIEEWQAVSTSIKGVESERDALTRSNGALSVQVLELEAGMERLLGDKEALEGALKGMAKEKEGLVREKEVLQGEAESVAREKKGMLTVKRSLEEGMERMKRENGVLSREKEALEGALDEMVKEKEGLVREKEVLREGIETLAREKAGLEDAKERLLSDKEGMEEGVGRMAKVNEGLVEEMGRAAIEKAGLEEALAEMKAELEKAVDERDGMRATLDHMEGSLDEIRMSKSVAESEKGVLAQEVVRLKGEAESLLMEKEHVMKQLDEMIEEVDDSKRRWEEQREELLMREREERWLRQKLTNATADLEAAQSKSLRLTIELQVSDEQVLSLTSELEAVRKEAAIARSHSAERDMACDELEKSVLDLTARCENAREELEQSMAREEASKRTLEQERRLAREVRHKTARREEKLAHDMSQAQTTISALRSENMVFKNEATRSRASELGDYEVHRLRVKAKELEEALSTQDLETFSPSAAKSESSQHNTQLSDLASARDQLARAMERAERIEKERDELLLIVAAAGQAPCLEASSSSSSSPPAAAALGAVPGDGIEMREMKVSAGKHRPRGLVARPRIEGL